MNFPKNSAVRLAILFIFVIVASGQKLYLTIFFYDTNSCFTLNLFQISMLMNVSMNEILRLWILFWQNILYFHLIFLWSCVFNNDNYIMFVYVDMCKKSDARGRTLVAPCQNDAYCNFFHPKGGCKCINTVCKCPPKINQQHQHFINTWV
jgi:hypothetical protein